jgi:hypothetical protein
MQPRRLPGRSLLGLLFFDGKGPQGYLLTGPRYLSSQARVSLIVSLTGGMWSVSQWISRFSAAGVSSPDGNQLISGRSYSPSRSG